MSSISVLSALNSISLIDKKIEKIFSEQMIFTGISVGGRQPNGFKTLVEFEDFIKSSYQKITDLIERRKEIKSKIILSNSITYINIANMNITVASAIELKKSIIYYMKLLDKLKRDFSETSYRIQDSNNKMEVSLENMIKNAFSNKSNTQIQQSEYSALSIPFKKDRESILIDPINIKEKIEKLENFIDDFTRNVDTLLTESNAKTMIDVQD